MKNYILVMSFSIRKLEELVNQYIDMGYEPHGAPQFVIDKALPGNSDVYSYLQAMVRKESKDEVPGTHT